MTGVGVTPGLVMASGGVVGSNGMSSSAGSGNGVNASIPSECWDSLSYLESAFHHGFMRSRLKTGDFVYYENQRVTRELDEFCDIDAMHQPKGPIILMGESGVGKSTFLANWLVRRKKMFQNWQSNYPEFIFYHVVGCSRQSLYVSNLLERILRELKEYFELNKEIPDVEERLSWQFPRFLEAASKKGRIILIIDGLQRLRTTDGESILKWVPLAFPPNVRLIFSGTITNPATKFLHMSANIAGPTSPTRPGIQSIDQFERPSMNAQLMERIKLEANRRNWTLVNVSPLLEEERWRVLKKFLGKYHPSKAQSAHKPLRVVGDAEVSNKGLLAVHGLQLFDLQQRAITSVPTTACALFLKTFLVSLAWAVNEGFNIHKLFEEWLAAESQEQLLEAVLRVMEVGYTPNEQAMSDARQFLQENRSTLSAEIAQAPSRRNTSSTSTLAEKQQQYSSRDGATSSMNKPQLIIPDFGNRPGTGKQSIELGFDEIPREEGIPLLQRLSSQHELAEVFIRTQTSRSDPHKNSIVSIPALPISAPDSGSTGSPPGTSTIASSIIPSQGSSSRQVLLHVPHEASFACDKILSRKNIEAMPPYLTGGQYVRPLGDLLGRALSLLYVSRHGLLEKELKFILNAVITEERQSAEPTYVLHRRASFSNVRNISSESPTAFSRAEWKALLRALKPLGVLCVQDVLVLPICKESLRDVVWWRYIGSERAEQQYHQWLIRFFRIHPTTFRRVEELPWHLKRCYQWDALRNVLVNLPTFQLLYTANFKVELFGYWKLLSDGPLPLYSATDTSIGDQLAYAIPFDVVKEYGRSIEDWYKSGKPTTKIFAGMVQLVTKFMYEFSMYYQGFLPVFNHAPFDLKKLHIDGFTFAEDLPHVQHITTSSSVMSAAAASGALMNLNANASPMAMSAAASAASALVTALDAYLTLNQQSAANVVQKDKESNGNWFYFYQRWIWIHYPWLALGKEIVLREPQLEMPLPGKGQKASSGPASGVSSSSFGLVPHSGPFSDPSSSSPVPCENSDITDEDRRDGSGSPVHPGGQGSAVGGPGNSNARSLQFDQRFWDVKRSMYDAVHQKQKGSVSPVKIRGLQNSSVIAVSSGTIHTESLISPENLFRKKSTFAAVKNVLSSSVRTLPGTSSASMPTLPGAQDGERSTTFLTEATQSAGVVDDKLALDSSAVTESGIMPSKSGVLTGIASRDQGLMEQLSSSDNVATLSTAFGLPAHFQDYPQSEWDLRKSYNYELVLKLQTLYDNTKLEVKKKQSHLQSVKQKIAETQKRYDFTMRECEMAKSAIEEMHTRMDKIEQMLKQIDKQEKTHRKLLRSCELYPASDPSHFEMTKKELRLLQMKLKDLVEEKKILQVKKNHLQTVELPILEREIERNKQLMSAVVNKLERAREKIAQDQAATEQLYQRRLELIDNVRTASPKEASGENSLEQEANVVAEHSVHATTRSLAAKVALQQCESMCEKIQKATGFSKLELILEKFVSREELNKSFEEQAKVYKARLKQIKLHQAELEQQLAALELSNAAASNEDPRLLEEKLRVAEVELARTERTQNVLLTTSKEVIAGASRIVKLLGITSCRTPHQNAISAAQLWPPPINGESALSSEFETLEAKEIAKLLQICQDRASVMIDVVEGGRGDPDANFTTTRDVNGKGRRSKGARLVDETITKPASRTKRLSHLGLKRDRVSGSVSFASGSLQPLQGGLFGNLDGLGINPNLNEPPPTPELDEDEKNLEVLSRDAIKVASRAKLTQKKRVKDALSSEPDHQD